MACIRPSSSDVNSCSDSAASCKSPDRPSCSSRRAASAALAAFKFTGEVLGFALANSVAYTSPKAIFLFGGLANAGELLFAPTIDSFEKNLLSIYAGKVSVLPSGLPENDAALLGAASLAWNELKKS